MRLLLVLLVQSTALLTLCFLALRLTQRRGPVVQTLVGRAALSGVTLLLLFLPLSGHVRAAWRIAPTPVRPSPTPPETGRVRALPGTHFTAPLPFVMRAPAVPALSVTEPQSTEKQGTASSAPTLSSPSSSNLPLREDPAPEERGSKAVGLPALLLLLWLAVCQWHLFRLRRTAQTVTAGPAAALLASLTLRPPLLFTQPSVHSPFLAGLRRPAIFLPPAYAADFDTEALQAIFVHEIAHRDRRDNFWTLTARVLTAVLWFQPLLWLLCCRLEQISEDACDKAVLASACPPRAYAACLLSLAERPPLGPRQRTLTAGVAPFRSSLGRRISRILTQGIIPMPPITFRLRLSIAALTLAAALGGAFLVSSAPAQTTASTSFIPTPQELLYRAQRKQDVQNLKVIDLALVMYERDNHYRLPSADKWVDQITPYLEQIELYRQDRSAFYDPFQPGQKRYGYAFNRNCSKKSLIAFAETVVVFDSTLGTRNASDTGASLRINPGPDKNPGPNKPQDMRLNPTSDYVFVDGHTKTFIQSVRPSFSLKGGPPAASAVGTRAEQLRLLTKELTANLRRQTPGASDSGSTTLNQAQFLAGLTPVQGPGVIVTLTDSKKPFPKAVPPGMAPPITIHDSDINQVVNELKSAGAEAISINDQRLVAISAVRAAGTQIFINNAAENAPYTVKAIGSSAALLSALSLPGGLASQIRQFDPAMFSVQGAATLTLPAYAGSGAPHYAKPVSGAETQDSPALFRRSFSINWQAPRQGVHAFQVFVVDAAGKHQVFSEVCPPGKLVSVPVNAVGEVVSFQIYDNGKLTKIQQMTGNPAAPAAGSAGHFAPASKGMEQFHDKTQAQLEADQKLLAEYEQSFQAQLHQALPQADAATLAKASNLESGLGRLTSSLQFIQQSVTHYAGKQYSSASLAKKYAQANQRHLDLIKVRQAQIKPLLTEEARLFPATADPRQHLAQVHIFAIKAYEAGLHVMVDTAQLGAINYSLKQYQRRSIPGAGGPPAPGTQ